MRKDGEKTAVIGVHKSRPRVASHGDFDRSLLCAGGGDSAPADRRVAVAGRGRAARIPRGPWHWHVGPRRFKFRSRAP